MAIVRPGDLDLAQRFVDTPGKEAPSVPPTEPPPTDPPPPPPVPDPTGIDVPPPPPAPPPPPPPPPKTDYEAGKLYPPSADGGQPDGSIPVGMAWHQTPNGMWMLVDAPEEAPPEEPVLSIEEQARSIVDQQIAAAPWYNQARMQSNYQGMLNAEMLKLKEIETPPGVAPPGDPGTYLPGQGPAAQARADRIARPPDPNLIPPDTRKRDEFGNFLPASGVATGATVAPKRDIYGRHLTGSLSGLNLNNMREFARTPAGRDLLTRIGR